MLSDLRVLEISAPATMLAGQILGDLGADVVALEPPAGAAGRRLPPFIDGRPGLERSLTWHALNRNKRSLTLDLASPDGRAAAAAMLGAFDVVIEHLQGVSQLDGLPRPAQQVACNVVDFCREGPKCAYAATDAVLMAAGGAPAMTGEPDRPPLFFPTPQAMMEAGAEAAVATLAALVARDRLGVGQAVEVEARVAAMLGSLGRLVSARSGDRIGRRAPAQSAGASPLPPGMYACADGWVTITVAFIPAFVAMTQRIARWLAEEGALPAAAAEADLLATAQAAARGEAEAGQAIGQLIAALADTCRRKTKLELAEAAGRHRFMAAPAMTMADVAAFQHYRERGLFAPQRVGEAVIDVPARFAQFSDYQIEVRRPAPGLGEHSVEILAELAGYSPLEAQALFAQGVI